MKTASRFLLAAGMFAVAGMGMYRVKSVEAQPAAVKADIPLLPPVNAKEPELSPEESTSIIVYEKVNRSVVNITNKSTNLDDFQGAAVRTGSGSGSILTKQGHVLTNFHVIDDATTLSVNLFDGSSYPAKIVGSDPNNDVAVLKIDAPADKLFPISWGDSNKLIVGMKVFAIGNPFGMERTLTTGIISSLNRNLKSENNRMIRGVIQTDAAINPGNSGGPLLNRRGEMIGMNTAIVGRANQSSGIGLAVPASTVRRVVEELIKTGHIIRPDIGIESVFQSSQGLLIGRITEEGPADKAGLKGPQTKIVQRGGTTFRQIDRSKADLIVAADGKSVRTLDELLTVVESHKPGEEVALTIIRAGAKQTVKVGLVESRD
ncbi:S1C family serine protease [Zavarzinella formosa]|uniref:S1C family serine protease n=1 Tax=Zavarzinella formosa TaxID=360055 RepID=UPI0002D8C278|nr:trypsin-like peptidase domain-containing protein [Zavarzinella formosa]